MSRVWGWRLGAGVLSGGALAAAFEPLGHWWVAWGALVPLLVAVRGASTTQAATAGLLAGLVFHLAVGAWVPAMLVQHTSLGPVAAAGVTLGIGALQAVFVGAFAVILVAAMRVGRSWIWLAPAAWVLTEEVRGAASFGVRWAFLGLSQGPVLPVAQVAAAAGVHGLSALVVLVNALLAAWVAGQRPWRSTVAVACGLATIVVWGAGRARRIDAMSTSAPLRVGVVQTRVLQDEKGRVESRRGIWAQLERATRMLARDDPDVVVWPETILPFELEVGGREYRHLARLVREADLPIVLGTIATDRPTPDHPVRRNRIAVATPGPGAPVRYDKRVLMPFGEYVPLAGWLPFVRPIVTGGAVSPAAAEDAGVIEVAGTRVGVLVCYEVLVPALARAARRAGATWLVNPSNDAWFGDTAVSEHLLAEARLRAIESGLPLVRVTNGGVSALVSPSGRVRWRAPRGRRVARVVDVVIRAVDDVVNLRAAAD
jgi:apolipoprotein N-acyltransferase